MRRAGGLCRYHAGGMRRVGRPRLGGTVGMQPFSRTAPQLSFLPVVIMSRVRSTPLACATSLPPVRRVHNEGGHRSDGQEAQFEDRSEGLGEEVRERVLAAALAHVPKHGWTSEALALAAAEHGLSPIAHGLFQQGPVELVEYFIHKCQDNMLEQLSTLDMEQMTLKEKIRAAMQARLKQYGPYIATWPQALAVLAQPANLSTSLSMMMNTVNDIIYVAGDSTVDFDWYTKRAVLAGVYTSTELFMLTDASDNFKDTWAFLDRRLEDVVKLSKYKAECETLVTLAVGYMSSVASAQRGTADWSSPITQHPPSSEPTTNPVHQSQHRPSSPAPESTDGPSSAPHDNITPPRT